MTTPIADHHFVVLGLARQGLAVTRWLMEQGAQVMVSDSKPEAELPDPIGSLRDLDVKLVLGGHPLSLLDECDVLCLSGGVPIDLPIVIEAQRRGIPLTNDAQLFVERCPAPIIGITGSAGKTTTTTLTGEIFKAAHHTTWVGGNIGNPLIGDLRDIVPTDRVVMELSSFQLDVMTVSPHVAAVLNITPNHLDRHPSMDAYVEAKRHILDFQSFDDIAVLGYDNEIARALSGRANGYVRFFSREKIVGRGAFLKGDRIMVVHNRAEEVCRLGDILLRGDHNVLNVLAACAMASALGVDVEPMAQAIREFKGVAHRLQLVREVNGVKYYDVSISTAPERVMADLQVFSEPIVLLAGGRDKDLPWEAWADEVTRRVDHLILFGEAAPKIAAALRPFDGRPRPITTDLCAGLEQAVQAAARRAETGDVVLLSPGGTSFDAFADFAERGDRFRALVRDL